MSFTIYCDSEVEAEWFVSACGNRLKNALITKIAKRGRNPETIDSLVSYDRPDIILCQNDKPVLVVEKTREVPTGHNVGQRFARLARAAELGVPSIYFLPYEARKHGEFENLCQLNPRLLLALVNMSKLHKVPAISINWRADEHGELVQDGSEDDQLKEALSGFLTNDCNANSKHLCDHIALMHNELKMRIGNRASYATPPKSIEFAMHRETTLRPTSIEKLSKRPFAKDREKSLVYTIGMLPESCKRQDPYTGMQFVYDYAYCRSGKTRRDRAVNLVLKFPSLTSEIFLSNNPNNPGTKSCNWYLLADGFEFSDKFVPNDE